MDWIAKELKKWGCICESVQLYFVLVELLTARWITYLWHIFSRVEMRGASETIHFLLPYLHNEPRLF